ncbi:MAG: hypothetical protein Q7T57_05145 [Dehalococcoidales bacterium]|nr:hypothetical protein [Dehalococcoidales bacterium]
MIQESNCGIGILGKEGAHAALSSDYVIHRFIHLIPLMFLHGRYNYYRTGQIVFFSFYKNMIFPVPMIIFSFYCYNSGQVYFVPILMSCFNLFFTSLPPLFCGWYERDIPEGILMQNPAAYASFKRYTTFSPRNFYEWMLQGFMHGFVLYYVMEMIVGEENTGSSVFHNHGMTTDMWLSGVQVFAGIIILANVKMTTTLKRVTWLNVTASVLGVVALLLILIIISSSYFPSIAPDAFGLLTQLFDTNITWLYLAMMLVVCLGPSLAIGGWLELYYPSPNQVSATSPNDAKGVESRRTLLTLLDQGGIAPSHIDGDLQLRKTPSIDQPHEVPSRHTTPPQPPSAVPLMQRRNSSPPTPRSKQIPSRVGVSPALGPSKASPTSATGRTTQPIPSIQL